MTDTVQEARKLHIALNVAIRRVGGTAPACDGAACSICAVLDAALRAQQEAEQRRDQLIAVVRGVRDEIAHSAMVAGQASIELGENEVRIASAEAARCERWCDQLNAVIESARGEAQTKTEQET